MSVESKFIYLCSASHSETAILDLPTRWYFLVDLPYKSESFHVSLTFSFITSIFLDSRYY